MPAARLTEASVKNAISGIADAGLKPSIVEFWPDGRIRFEFFASNQALISLVEAKPEPDGEPLSWPEAT